MNMVEEWEALANGPALPAFLEWLAKGPQASVQAQRWKRGRTYGGQITAHHIVWPLLLIQQNPNTGSTYARKARIPGKECSIWWLIHDCRPSERGEYVGRVEDQVWCPKEEWIALKER